MYILVISADLCTLTSPGTVVVSQTLYIGREGGSEGVEDVGRVVSVGSMKGESTSQHMYRPVNWKVKLCRRLEVDRGNLEKYVCELYLEGWDCITKNYC